MSRTGTSLATIAASAAGLFGAFLALSPTAAADPVTPTNPGATGPNVVQEIAAGPQGVSQLIQNAASVLTGVPPTPATPPTPPPLASASFNLPQPLPATATSPATGAATPTGQLSLPSIPGLPAGLTNLALPSDLTSLLPAGGLLPGLSTKPVAAPAAAAVPAAAPAQSGLSALLPFSALP